MSEMIDGISHINTDELDQILQDANNQALIIDVREHEEYLEFHIPGVPLIPMGQIAQLVDQFDKNREYIFVCRSGKRSYEVAKYFKLLGFEQVHNYAGGMLDWDREIASGPDNIITEFDPELLERKQG
ncbi:rhodanese-related sulfurtransferase [Fontibacillus solani]|uniref:Rhodanese-related sulfurtransferase n=1 Tax=Fontibacillus solani TaxID=1572857 RepID=A0A7W3SSS7_9BACL|nr:rhodanese-like domain-containing protein [Fontibacillus solani]MBA9085434.1 rhodanese-related sulfurtransferase [Fontibacillus solani]